MKYKILILLIFSSISAFAKFENNLNAEGVAISGYDAVSYFTSDKPVPGLKKFQVKQGDAIYYFATEENQKKFLKDPHKYEPQFGGWCAYAVADSNSKVEVDPLSYSIQDGRLLLFYKGLWGNTRQKWLTDSKKTPQQYLSTADKNWPTIVSKEP